MRVWSTQRPIFIGTYPKEYGVKEIVNFGGRKMVPEIGRLAYGYIDYEQDLPKEEQKHYDLWPEVMEDPKLEAAAKALAAALEKSDMSKISKVLEKAYETNLIDDDEQLVRAAQKYM